MNVQKINYQKELDKILKRLEEEGRVPTLLIHSCCAPCSSYVLEYLSRYFRITVLYYNPNIYPESEYTKRIIRAAETDKRYAVSISGLIPCGKYDKEKFYEMAKGWSI